MWSLSPLSPLLHYPCPKGIPAICNDHMTRLRHKWTLTHFLDPVMLFGRRTCNLVRAGQLVPTWIWRGEGRLCNRLGSCHQKSLPQVWRRSTRKRHCQESCLGHQCHPLILCQHRRWHRHALVPPGQVQPERLLVLDTQGLREEPNRGTCFTGLWLWLLLSPLSWEEHCHVS